MQTRRRWIPVLAGLSIPLLLARCGSSDETGKAPNRDTGGGTGGSGAAGDGGEGGATGGRGATGEGGATGGRAGEPSGGEGGATGGTAGEPSSGGEGGTDGPSCSDALVNGTETDVDCGGTCPTKCAAGKSCDVATDCASSSCNASKRCTAGALSFSEKARARGCRPYDMIAVRLDEDAFLDVAVGCMGGGSVNLYYGKGDDTFENPIDITMGTLPRVVAATDLDADGLSDLVSANYTSHDISVRLNSGGRVFADPTPYPVASGPDALLLADLDGDLDPDIVFADGNIGSLLNDGSGAFAPAVFGAVLVPTGHMVAGNFAGSASTDVVGPSNSLFLFIGGGDGSFAVATPQGSMARSLAAADFNGDDIPDVVAVNVGGGAELQIFPATGGSPAFGAPTASFANPGEAATHPVVADFDLDGNQDVAMAVAALENELRVYRGAGNGSLTTTSPAPVCSTDVVAASAVGDFDGDGLVDVAVACDSSGGQSGVVVMKNTSQ